jgi:hypothetical protein
VLLPADAREWPAERIRIVLAHEFAHIARRDWIAQLGASLFQAICWFNPVVWLACRILRRQSELACDDEVLRLGVEAPAYAGHLLAIAKSFRVERAGIFGVELRPQTTTVGLATLDAQFVDRRVFATAPEPGRFLTDLAEATDEVRHAHPGIVCEGMGVSRPGRVDDQGSLMFAPNLAWPLPVAIGPMIAGAVGLPVNVENAANACALAELWFGQHPDHVRHIVAVTVSEGIGVGLLLNGQLVHGAHSMAGEFGHRVMDPSGSTGWRVRSVKDSPT